MTIIFNPRQTILVSCRGDVNHFGLKKEIDELFPCDWHMPISFNPPKYAICINKKMTFEIDTIKNAKSFAINFMSIKHKSNIIKCAENEGKFINKFEESNLSAEESEHIDAPRVKESVAFLECELIEELDQGDHILFIANVIHSNLKDALAKRIFHVDNNNYTSTK